MNGAFFNSAYAKIWPQKTHHKFPRKKMSKRPLDTENEAYALISRLLDESRRIAPRDADALIARIVEIGMYVVTIIAGPGATVYRVLPESRMEEIYSLCQQRGWAMVAARIAKSDPAVFKSKLPTDAAAFWGVIDKEDWAVMFYDRYGTTTLLPVSGHHTPSEVQSTVETALQQAGVTKYACTFQITSLLRGAWSNKKVNCDGLRKKIASGIKRDGEIDF